jgi:hypothetical protein
MTKNEAIEAMKKGERVTHDFFLPNEWVTMDEDGFIRTEENYLAYPEQFWADRRGLSWNAGWSVYNPSTTPNQ